MSKKLSIMERALIFQDKKVRTHWDTEREEWYSSVMNVVAVLTDNKYQLARNYRKVLKHRIEKEGDETVTNCNQLKMLAPDGRMRLTDEADTKQLLRIIQSIPSPKAEPFKQWLAPVGVKRLDEIANPERAIVRGADLYRAKGYSEGWINQRLQTIENECYDNTRVHCDERETISGMISVNYKVEQLSHKVDQLNNYVEEILHDQNDINRMQDETNNELAEQIEAINEALDQLRSIDAAPRKWIGFKQGNKVSE